MTISLNLSNKLDLRLVSAIKAIHDVATKLDLPFFIIGATARDIILQHGFGIQPMRATVDIDFAVQVESWDQFDQLKREIITTSQFAPTTDIHRLSFSEGLPVDIIPYGSLADNQNIAWPPDYDISMSVEGFYECYNHSICVLIQNNPEISVQVVTLEGLALLKLISWDENPHIRNKDAVDLFIIMHHYMDAGNIDRLYNEAGDLFDESDIPDYDAFSARLLGRTISKMLSNSKSIKHTVIQILNRETDTDNVKGLVQTIVLSGSFPQYSYQRVAELFEHLKIGLCERP